MVKNKVFAETLIIYFYLKFRKFIYPKLTFCWNKPNKLLPTMAAIIKTKATIAKRAPTSFKSYGALNKGFWSAIVIEYINAI